MSTLHSLLSPSVRPSVGRYAIPVLSLVSGEGPGPSCEQEVRLPSAQEERDQNRSPSPPSS